MRLVTASQRMSVSVLLSMNCLLLPTEHQNTSVLMGPFAVLLGMGPALDSACYMFATYQKPYGRPLLSTVVVTSWCNVMGHVACASCGHTESPQDSSEARGTRLEATYILVTTTSTRMMGTAVTTAGGAAATLYELRRYVCDRSLIVCCIWSKPYSENRSNRSPRGHYMAEIYALR